MSKSGFFQKGAFYGGTALRIFYGLHRFSEDMDFSLMYPDPSFALSDYLPAVEEELSAVGLKMHVEQKNKTKVTDIQSAFIKGGTLIQVISIQQTDEILIPGIHKQEQLKIKLEVDTNPPPGAGVELRYALRPVPYAVRLYDKPSLFAGKIHAVLCRNVSITGYAR
ncbi:nucleotidyl transferase AbiEii/AbiGii toxin family protein [Mitsuokella multacida]|uniref:nucleotidyl transferase AbiEii/AbiGii toxin family protein n=1 Tax=Mitsuokella multacida TaxID=52226 RepID=UPI003F7E9B70